MILPDMLSPDARASRFARISASAMTERRVQGEDGVGTLAEKWQHQIIKRYLSEDTSHHEVKLNGTRFVSDVRVENEVFEVQSADFFPMKKKIDYYLTHTDLTVTVVHPLAKNRLVSQIDPKTQEISAPKKSPRHSAPIELLPKLYPLMPYLKNERLKFRLLLLEVQDFKLLSENRRKNASRFERIPTALLEDLTLSSPADFRALLPPSLPSPFTVKQFSKLTKLRGRDAYSAVHALEALGILSPAPPVGRAMAFWIT